MIEQILNTVLDTVDISFKWLLIAINTLTIILAYIYKSRNRRPPQHHILLVTAHPDDECMFFRPTITNLIDTYFVHVLCLTGRGTGRERQLRNACRRLGVGAERVVCVGDAGLVDGVGEVWEGSVVGKYVVGYIRENNIKAVFTFDGYGVSNHPNHKSIYTALKKYQVQGTNTHRPQNTIKIYYLQSVNLPRKYSGLLQLPISLLQTYSWIDISPFRAYAAMREHESQFVWFRKLWVFFSRYQYVNTYRRGFIRVEGGGVEGKGEGEGEGEGMGVNGDKDRNMGSEIKDEQKEKENEKDKDI